MNIVKPGRVSASFGPRQFQTPRPSPAVLRLRKREKIEALGFRVLDLRDVERRLKARRKEEAEEVR